MQRDATDPFLTCIKIPKKYTFLDGYTISNIIPYIGVLTYYYFDIFHKNPSLKMYTFLDGHNPKRLGTFCIWKGMGTMRKGLLLGALLALSTSLQPVHAQEVTVVGMGMDKDSALRDASRVAVEQVVGTLIDARTLMKDLRIELDEVCKKSHGFIKKITVLSEGPMDASTYRVQARIDVDTNPNAELMDQLTMMMRLNDPRIAVVVLNSTSQGQPSHNEDTESILNARLVELGFNHVIDVDHVIKLYDAKFLNNIYEGRTGLSNVGSDNACEFLVLGKVSANVANVGVPDYKSGQMLAAPLINAQTKLNVKILKYDTGDIIGTFVSTGSGIGINNGRAMDTGLAVAASEAANHLEKTFKQFGAKVSTGMAVTIIAKDYSQVEALTQTLRSLGDVNNVYIRSQDRGKTLLEIDTPQKPHVIAAAIRSHSQMNVIVETITNSGLTLRIP